MRKKSLYILLSLFALCGTLGNAWGAPFAYITNDHSNDVSVIDMATNSVIGAPIPVGAGPVGVAANPAGTRVYVTNNPSNTVSESSIRPPIQ